MVQWLRGEASTALECVVVTVKEVKEPKNLSARIAYLPNMIIDGRPPGGRSLSRG